MSGGIHCLKQDSTLHLVHLCIDNKCVDKQCFPTGAAVPPRRRGRARRRRRLPYRLHAAYYAPAAPPSAICITRYVIICYDIV